MNKSQNMDGYWSFWEFSSFKELKMLESYRLLSRVCLNLHKIMMYSFVFSCLLNKFSGKLFLLLLSEVKAIQKPVIYRKVPVKYWRQNIINPEIKKPQTQLAYISNYDEIQKSMEQI